MRRDVFSLLRCAACSRAEPGLDVFAAGADDEVLDGVVWCRSCLSWFPIEDGLLEFLAGGLAYRDDRRHFWIKHADRLKSLGLAHYPETTGERGHELQSLQQHHFDWYADNQRQTYSEYERRPFWTAADRIAFEPWKREIQPGRRLLDVGCAQGRSTFKVTDLDIDVVGFDVSKPLVRQAILRQRQANPRARTTFFAADASRFPFVEASFDYVLVYGVLHHLPDAGQTCQEIARVLKPGGVYFGSENNLSAFRCGFDLLQKINPLWHEVAGPEAVLSDARLKGAFKDTGMDVRTTTSVFLPPHLIDRLTADLGFRLLSMTDRIGRSLPFLRNNGGLILIRGIKRAP